MVRSAGVCLGLVQNTDYKWKMPEPYSDLCREIWWNSLCLHQAESFFFFFLNCVIKSAERLMRERHYVTPQSSTFTGCDRVLMQQRAVSLLLSRPPQNTKTQTATCLNEIAQQSEAQKIFYSRCSKLFNRN